MSQLYVESEGEFSKSRTGISNDELQYIRCVLGSHDDDNGTIASQVQQHLKENVLSLKILSEFDDLSLQQIIESWNLDTNNKSPYVIRGLLIRGIKKFDGHVDEEKTISNDSTSNSTSGNKNNNCHTYNHNYNQNKSNYNEKCTKPECGNGGGDGDCTVSASGQQQQIVITENELKMMKLLTDYEKSVYGSLKVQLNDYNRIEINYNFG